MCILLIHVCIIYIHTYCKFQADLWFLPAMFFLSFSFWDSWPSHLEQTTASRELLKKMAWNPEPASVSTMAMRSCCAMICVGSTMEYDSFVIMNVPNQIRSDGCMNQFICDLLTATTYFHITNWYIFRTTSGASRSGSPSTS